jgi:TPR repeat protein
MFERACSNGVLRGCAEAGWIAFHGYGVAADVDAGIKRLEDACAASVGNACLVVGDSLSFEEKRPKDPVAATAWYERGCALDDAWSCFHLGNQLIEGTGIAADIARAASLMAKACDSGLPAGCAGVGWLYSAEGPLGRDDARALSALDRACMLGDGDSCARLGQLKVTAGDDDGAAASFSAGCNLNSGWACVEWALMVERSADTVGVMVSFVPMSLNSMSCVTAPLLTVVAVRTGISPPRNEVAGLPLSVTRFGAASTRARPSVIR